MIFDPTPDQIKRLNSDDLVQLLRRLMHAEAQLAGIDLRNVSAPLQITVADGGEDARVEWEGGHEKTGYFPARFTAFQSKATNVGAAGWKREVWKKASVRKGPPRLNKAITNALAKNGAYIGFTSTPVVGPKRDKCIQAIKDGITAGGGDPQSLAAIDIYDANRIAAWASRHPAVAVWISERLAGVTLAGFQTIDRWATLSDFATIPRADDSAARFVHRTRALAQEEPDNSGEEVLTAEQASGQIIEQLSEPGKVVRLFGPSGYGKSRFVLELLKDASTVLKESVSSSAIYCDYRTVGAQLLQMAVDFANRGISALIIVDECPRGIALQLLDIATSEGSKLRLLTIGIDDQPTIANGCLNISIGPANDELIEKIIRSRLPSGTNEEVEYIRSLCGGVPRIAVLATDDYAKRSAVLGSIGDVAERILIGSGVVDPDDVRAIEVLSLFDRLGADEELGEQLDFVATQLLGTTGDRMYESLARASGHLLVHRRGRFFTTQPIPIANYLGLRRLSLLRVNTLLRFIDEAPRVLLKQFFRSLRRFDSSRTVVKVAERLLSWTGKYGTREALESEVGAECLDALVHVAPDSAADALQRVFGDVPIDELLSISDSPRRSLVRALEKLVFRRSSFANSARLLMRFAAAENENWSNNATSLFKQLFQLRLSGTQASPSERFVILDEGLASTDDRVVSVCVSALGTTLQNGRFVRSGGAEQIGTKPPLKEWAPKQNKEVFDYWREGIRRLLRLRADRPALASQCKSIIASNLRGLLYPDLLSDLERVIAEVTSTDGVWLEAIRGIGDWVYYDSSGAPSEFTRRVKALLEEIMPRDPIDKARLYTRFWSADIHDPESVYSSTDHDFDYSSRKARELAAEIGADQALTERAIIAMAAEELHNVHPFAEELALEIEDPISAFRLALGTLEAAPKHHGTQFVRGLLYGIHERNSEAGNSCLQLALNSAAFKGQEVNLFTSVPTTPKRISEIVKSLREGTFEPRHCVYLSYGKGLDKLSAEELAPLLAALCEKGSEGMWTALEVITMYQHGRGTLDSGIEAFIKRITVAPEILSQGRDSGRDGHVLEENVERLAKHAKLDDEYGVALSEQIVRIIKIDDYGLRHNLEDAFRKVIAILVKEKPSIVWNSLSRFFEAANPSQRDALENLVGPDRLGSDGTGHTKAGILFGIPENLMLDWAKAAPQDRVSFLCTFFPVFSDPEQPKDWAPAMQRLALEFGSVKEFRDALSSRLEINSWSGSIVPHLRAYFVPLESWEAHPIPQVAEWAREMRRRLDRRIEAERQRDLENR
jgi:hypothetical protein